MKQDFSLPPAPKRPLGEVNIWLASIGLSLGLIMIFGLLGIIVFNGLEAFWPKTIHELTLAPSSKEEQPLVLYAGITKDLHESRLRACSGGRFPEFGGWNMAVSGRGRGGLKNG